MITVFAETAAEVHAVGAAQNAALPGGLFGDRPHQVIRVRPGSVRVHGAGYGPRLGGGTGPRVEGVLRACCRTCPADPHGPRCIHYAAGAWQAEAAP